MGEKRAYSDTKKGIKLAEKKSTDARVLQGIADPAPENDKINLNLTQIDKWRKSKEYGTAAMYSDRTYDDIIYSDLSENEKDKYMDALEKRTKRLERAAHKEFIAKYGHDVKYGGGDKSGGEIKFGGDVRYEPGFEVAIPYTRNVIDHINRRRIMKAKSGLEHKTLAVLMAAGILAGLFFLSPNFTGNIIGNLNQTSSNWLGVALLIAGLVGGFFWMRGR